MHGAGIATKSSTAFKLGQRRTARLLAILGLVAMIAASCGSNTTTAADADSGTTEQPDVTTTVAEVESTTTTTTTTVEPEPEVEDETPPPAPDEAVITFVEAFGSGDVVKAFSFVSQKCQKVIAATDSLGYAAYVGNYAANAPGTTPSNIYAEIRDGDIAAISYDNHDETGEKVESYNFQRWIFVEGDWYWDAC